MGRRRYDGAGRVGSIAVYFRRSEISKSHTKVQILNLQPSIFIALEYLNVLFFIVGNCETVTTIPICENVSSRIILRTSD